VKQHLLNFLTLTSLLLCGAVLVLWVRSYRACDALVRPARAGDRLCVTSEFGVLVLEWEGPLRGAVLPGWEYFQSPLPRRWPVRTGMMGFETYRGRVTHFVRLPPSTLKGVVVPHWAVALALAALPARWVLRLSRARLARRRRDAGLCRACGYDLRATADKCPECGHAPPASGPVAIRRWRAPA
jgi:hypothetical protein